MNWGFHHLFFVIELLSLSAYAAPTMDEVRANRMNFAGQALEFSGKISSIEKIHQQSSDTVSFNVEGLDESWVLNVEYKTRDGVQVVNEFKCSLGDLVTLTGVYKPFGSAKYIGMVEISSTYPLDCKRAKATGDAADLNLAEPLVVADSAAVKIAKAPVNPVISVSPSPSITASPSPLPTPSASLTPLASPAAKTVERSVELKLSKIKVSQPLNHPAIAHRFSLEVSDNGTERWNTLVVFREDASKISAKDQAATIGARIDGLKKSGQDPLAKSQVTARKEDGVVDFMRSQSKDHVLTFVEHNVFLFRRVGDQLRSVQLARRFYPDDKTPKDLEKKRADDFTQWIHDEHLHYVEDLSELMDHFDQYRK